MTARTRRWLTWLATAIAVLPYLLAVVRAIAEGWQPVSDVAFIATRALDVLSFDHHPLVGTVSSLSGPAGTIVHHPGPLLFDLLAVPSWALGTDVGIPLAVSGLNAACSWWVVSLAGRVGGLGVRLASAVAVALLAWAMTWPLLVDPWNPHARDARALVVQPAGGHDVARKVVEAFVVAAVSGARRVVGATADRSDRQSRCQQRCGILRAVTTDTRTVGFGQSLSVATKPGPGCVVGSLDGALALTVTFEAVDR